MKFDCSVKIVDSIMGAGKTQAIMNYINSTNEDEKFLVITPFLDEVERYKSYCPTKKFKAPDITYSKDTRTSSKLNGIKRLIEKGTNIVSTHALFQKFDNELIDLCRAKNYTLILDEVANVVNPYDISKDDCKTLISTYTDINPETKQLIWKEEYKDYTGKYDDEKRLCDLGSLVAYGDNNLLMVWLFPIEVFNAFRNIYILTYRFDLQLQRYYYDYYGLEYEYLSATGNSLDNYHLVPYTMESRYLQNINYSSLIHICDKEKLNMIGDRETDLSMSWYWRNKDNGSIKVLQNNISNFFRNIREDKSEDNIWTTFKDYENILKGKGYTKGFLEINARATNKYKDRTSIAYVVNRYMNTFVKNFFIENGIEVNEDGFALTEMLQFIWRSAIRDGKEIWIYIPSIRMRRLLQEWINESTKEEI